MVRRFASWSVFLILAAWSAPAPTTPTAADLPREATPTAVPATTSRPPASTPAAQASSRLQATPVPPELASSVLLARWNTDTQRHEVVPVDPMTGQVLANHIPISIGDQTMVRAPAAIAADRSVVALVESGGRACEPAGIGASCRASAAALQVVALPSWRTVRIALPDDGWVGPLAFDSPATRLAVVFHTASESTLFVFDVSSGAQLAQHTLALRPEVLGFGAGGTELVLYGQPRSAAPGIEQPDPPRALVLDAATLELRWEQALDSILSGAWCVAACAAAHAEQVSALWQPAVALSHDGRTLFVVHADAGQLMAVDWETRTVHSTALGERASSFELLLRATADRAAAKGQPVGAVKRGVLSPDSARLYVLSEVFAEPGTTADPQASSSSLGLQVVDVERGRVVAEQAVAGGQLGLTADGAHILLHQWGPTVRTEVLDATSLARIAEVPEWELVATRRLDGTPIVVAKRTLAGPNEHAVLDGQTFAALRTWEAENRAYWVSAGDGPQ